MSLKILHISDIHFRDYKNHQFLDLDKEIQREIEIDLEALHETYGKIDIVLLGGDIAFSGAPEEYIVADQWIKTICRIIGCKEENVLTVPGNHDIDRRTFFRVLEDMQKELKSSKNRNELDGKIADYVRHVDSAEILFRPLKNYNEFAQKYGSISDARNVLYWEKSFAFDERVLRIRGINSAISSSELDHVNTSKLVLGSSQTCFLREKGVVYLVLCHHPPQWLFDGDEAVTDLKARARVHLFGHKHMFDSDVINNSNLVLAAGAMQPSRSESNWEPRYNILDLSIKDEINRSSLIVKLYKRVWNKYKKKFIAEHAENGEICEDYSLSLTVEEANKIEIPKMNEKEAMNNDVLMAEPVIDINEPNPRRKLAYLFLGLPYHLKLIIAVELELIEDSDKDLDEIQKTQSYFKRCIERNLLAQLWDKVTIANGNPLKNPF